MAIVHPMVVRTNSHRVGIYEVMLGGQSRVHRVG